MITRFTTRSGAKYLLEDNQLTRLAEHPVLDHGNGYRPIPPSDLLQLPVLEIGCLEVGSRALFITARGPLHTTEVTELIKE